MTVTTLAEQGRQPDVGGMGGSSSVNGSSGEGCGNGNNLCVAARMAARRRRPAGSLVQDVREWQLLEAAFRGWLAVTRLQSKEQQLAMVRVGGGLAELCVWWLGGGWVGGWVDRVLNRGRRAEGEGKCMLSILLKCAITQLHKLQVHSCLSCP
jgi:hypothetical protein